MSSPLLLVFAFVKTKTSFDTWKCCCGVQTITEPFQVFFLEFMVVSLKARKDFMARLPLQKKMQVSYSKVSSFFFFFLLFRHHFLPCCFFFFLSFVFSLFLSFSLSLHLFPFLFFYSFHSSTLLFLVRKGFQGSFLQLKIEISKSFCWQDQHP